MSKRRIFVKGRPAHVEVPKEKPKMTVGMDFAKEADRAAISTARIADFGISLEAAAENTARFMDAITRVTPITPAYATGGVVPRDDASSVSGTRRYDPLESYEAQTRPNDAVHFTVRVVHRDYDIRYRAATYRVDGMRYDTNSGDYARETTEILITDEAMRDQFESVAQRLHRELCNRYNVVHVDWGMFLV